jgi:hypothetical protein
MYSLEPPQANSMYTKGRKCSCYEVLLLKLTMG